MIHLYICAPPHTHTQNASQWLCRMCLNNVDMMLIWSYPTCCCNVYHHSHFDSKGSIILQQDVRWRISLTVRNWRQYFSHSQKRTDRASILIGLPTAAYSTKIILGSAVDRMNVYFQLMLDKLEKKYLVFLLLTKEKSNFVNPGHRRLGCPEGGALPSSLHNHGELVIFAVSCMHRIIQSPSMCSYTVFISII